MLFENSELGLGRQEISDRCTVQEDNEVKVDIFLTQGSVLRRSERPKKELSKYISFFQEMNVITCLKLLNLLDVIPTQCSQIDTVSAQEESEQCSGFAVLGNSESSVFVIAGISCTFHSCLATGGCKYNII